MTVPDLPLVLTVLAALSLAARAARPTLRFKPGRKFKIVQFCDVQDNHDLDPRTSAAMNRLLDAEKPEFVVLTGDTVSTGECEDASQLQTAIAKIVEPMEARGIPWAVVMGNHDVDGLEQIGVDKSRMLEMYRSYPLNCNPHDPKGVYGTGNGLLQVLGSQSEQPAFGIWLLDSNAYAPSEIGGQELGGYDWIHTSQVAWYSKTSQAVERKLGRKLPSLMFFHICVPEFGLLAASERFTGERNEVECPAQVNGGMFAAALDRGDVLGMYVGHEHTNNYEGTWLGIRLGFSGSIGYHSYGLDSEDETVRNRIRGARVFEIDEANPAAYQTTYVYVGEVS